MWDWISGDKNQKQGQKGAWYWTQGEWELQEINEKAQGWRTVTQEDKGYSGNSQAEQPGLPRSQKPRDKEGGGFPILQTAQESSFLT